MELLSGIFGSDGFMPHGHCYLWRPDLIVLHVGSDALIGTAYIVISLTLWQLVRRIRLPFSPMILAFGVFIGACGLTHYMEVYTLWTPDYWLSGLVKLVTAVASVATGAYLVGLRPLIVEVTRSMQLAEERRVALEAKNAELSALYARVKDLDDAKTRFFANVSHELRTPLALVLGPIEKLLARGLPDEDARRDMEVARRNARTLLHHVDDLLDVARLEEGGMPLRWARFDLARLVREAAGAFEGLARERRVALSIEAPQALAVEGDAEKLERVLANLLGNAFRHVPEGGHVRCAVSATAERAAVSVEDDGPGIAPHLRQAVFERFRQGAGRGEGGGGAGLGLAIAHDFVGLHGGTIVAGEAEGGGARLTFELPLRAPPGANVSAAPAQAPRAAATTAEALREEPALPRPWEGGGRPVVLVVEDHPEMRRFVAEALGPELAVATAADGAEALRMAEALHPDLVLTDVMMPHLDGARLMGELRARPRLAEVPVIVLTAHADDALRASLLRAGAVDYLVKPFQTDELRARVRNAVAMKRSREVLGRELAQPRGELEDLARELAQRKRELQLAVQSAQVAREQAERASAVKSTFLGMISHELRTPLTSMKLAVSALRSPRDAPLSQRQRVQLDRIERSSARLLGLIEAMLEYTRLEAGKLVVRTERVELAHLVEEVVDEARPQAQRKLLALDVDAKPVPPVETDPRLLRLVLVNLVVNAVKYTERGGVRVLVRQERDGHVLEVVDTGPGIPAAERVRVFEPFHQLGKPGTVQGVGLGLSLVKGVAKALGAKLSVESELGRGTTFRVVLPPEARWRGG